MEVQPITLEALLDGLRNIAAEHQTPLVIQARIAVSRREARLLAVEPERPLETIRY
jgi:hypothetical protein